MTEYNVEEQEKAPYKGQVRRCKRNITRKEAQRPLSYGWPGGMKAIQYVEFTETIIVYQQFNGVEWEDLETVEEDLE